jgi:hypothetical protein
VVNGARGDPDAALVSAGGEMKRLSGFSLAATFEGEFSGNTTSYSRKLVARTRGELERHWACWRLACRRWQKLSDLFPDRAAERQLNDVVHLRYTSLTPD